MPGLLENQALQDELQNIAGKTGQTVEQVRELAESNLREMRSKRNELAVRSFAGLSTYLCRRGYHSDIFYDTAELDTVRRLASVRSVVFLVSHKTYLDFFVLFAFFQRLGIPSPYVFGGINMAFGGFGSLARRAGGIFIRRTFADDLVYKAVLHRYIQSLVEQGCSFMWAIEGTRSRTGKLVMPKLGLLKYVSEAGRGLGDDSITYVPVSVAYDQIPDVIDMAAQEAGGTKQAESMSWFVRYVRGLDGTYGNIYVRFGDAVLLHETPDAPDLTTSQALPDPEIVEIEKLAFEICYRINEVTPATVSSLILMCLLCRGSASVERIRADVASLQDHTRQRQSSSLFYSPNRPITDCVDADLLALTKNGVVCRKGEKYSIAAERYLVALYYSNMAVHHFVIAAFTELGLLNMSHADRSSADGAFWSEILRLRDLFKFEFFFSRKDRFKAQFVEELHFLDTTMESIEEQDPAYASELLQHQPLLVAHGVLSPYIDAYRIVADFLMESDTQAFDDQAAFVADCQARGKKAATEYGFPGVASRALLANGYSLAKNRGLLGNGEDVGDRRRRFADELTAISYQLDEIRQMTR